MRVQRREVLWARVRRWAWMMVHWGYCTFDITELRTGRVTFVGAIKHGVVLNCEVRDHPDTIVFWSGAQ